MVYSGGGGGVRSINFVVSRRPLYTCTRRPIRATTMIYIRKYPIGSYNNNIYLHPSAAAASPPPHKIISHINRRNCRGGRKRSIDRLPG